jgi:hypothetical protein
VAPKVLTVHLTKTLMKKNMERTQKKTLKKKVKMNACQGGFLAIVFIKGSRRY